MTKSNIISESVENYLKAIYHCCRGDEGASVQDIATCVGVSTPGVSKMLRYLAKHQLVDYAPYQRVHLRELGEKIALEVIRHHRLLELYLMESLGYSWEQVHSEAERLEHHISEEFEDTIERLLGFPQFDPHGDPIPTRDGKLPRRITETLASQLDGSEIVIRRVTDENVELLRYFADRGLRPGTPVTILSREPFGGSLRLQIGDREERITPEAARNIFVEKLALPESSGSASRQK
jgi:DtxR family transcriptional regulator, Mn-dependent transcriptional regulator